MVVMWLTTQYGCYSILQIDADRYALGAPCAQDLEHLMELTKVECVIHYRQYAEAGYWIRLDLEALLEVMLQLAVSIDYCCFAGPDRQSGIACKLGGTHLMPGGLLADCFGLFHSGCTEGFLLPLTSARIESEQLTAPRRLFTAMSCGH